MQERTHRLIYAAETILIGAPSMTVCIPLLIMGTVSLGLLFAEPSLLEWSALPIVALIFCGGAGVFAWLVLTGNYLFAGPSALLSAPSGWWVALAAGLAAALGLIGVMLAGGGWLKPIQWLFGPAMALPASHLFWLKLKQRQVHHRLGQDEGAQVDDLRRTEEGPLSLGPRSPVPGPPPSPESRIPSPGL